MKKLLNVSLLCRIVAIIAVSVLLYFMFFHRKVPARIAAYDYRICDSFRGGMPDYGLYKRKNLLSVIKTDDGCGFFRSFDYDVFFT